LLEPGTPPKLADAIDALVSKATAKDPRRRFDDAMQMKQAVRALLGSG
jgi:hypothetical protein